MRFSILGELDVTDAGGSLPLGGAKQRALLTILLLHANEPLSADRLVGDLWGERPPSTAAKSLQMHVTRLRRALGEHADLLVTSPTGYRLAIDPDSLDLTRFTTLAERGRRALADGQPAEAATLLEAALAEWRGSPLADVAYEAFAQSEIARLEQLRIAVVEDRIDAELALGHHAEWIGEIESLIAEHPYRERLRGQLMLALYREGRQAEALSVYRETHRILSEALGITPTPALQKLETALLAQDPVLDWHGSTAPPERAATTLPDRLREVSAPAFVGRERESARLWSAWEDVKAGERRLALIAGEPGIGKTRLAAQLATRVHADGGSVLYGVCDEDIGLPHRPWVDGLSEYIAAAPANVLDRHAAVHGGTLARLVPIFAQRLPGAPATGASEPEVQRYMLYEAVADLLRDASGDAPLLFVLDDLHWADQPTLLLLRHVIARGAMRVLVVGTYRHSELRPESPLADLLALLHRQPGVERMALDGLQEPDVLALLHARGSTGPGANERAFAHDLTSETSGNPFFLTEILRHLLESGALEQSPDGWRLTAKLADVGMPDSVREVVAHRVRRLGEATATLLGQAAVIGREFDARCSRAWRASRRTAARAARRGRPGDAAARGAGGARPLHVHPRAAQPDAGARARRRAARAVARADRRRAAGDARARAARRARAPPDRGGRRRRAGRRGVPGGRPAGADRARAGRGGALVRAGTRPGSGRGRALRAARRPRRGAAPGRPRRLPADAAGRGRARLRARRRRPARARHARQQPRVRERLRPHRRRARRTRCATRSHCSIPPTACAARSCWPCCSWSSRSAHRCRSGARLSDEALALARDAGDATTLGHVLWARHAVLWTPELLEEHRANAAELSRIAGRSSDPVTKFWAATDSVLVSAWSADLRAVDDGLARMRAIAERTGQPLLRWVALWYAAWRAHLAGRARRGRGRGRTTPRRSARRAGSRTRSRSSPTSS